MSALPGRTGATARGERCCKARRQLDLPERARAKQMLECDGKGGKRRFVRVRLQRLVSLHLVAPDRVPSRGVANGESVRRSRTVPDRSGRQIHQSDKRIIPGGSHAIQSDVAGAIEGSLIVLLRRVVSDPPGDGRYVEEDVDDLKCRAAKAVAMQATIAGSPQPAGLTLEDATHALASPLVSRSDPTVRPMPISHDPVARLAVGGVFSCFTSRVRSAFLVCWLPRTHALQSQSAQHSEDDNCVNSMRHGQGGLPPWKRRSDETLSHTSYSYRES